MKFKKIIFFVFTLMIVLSGCAKNDEHIENEKLKVYSLDELFFYNVHLFAKKRIVVAK